MELLNKEFIKYWNEHHEKMVMPIEKKKELRKNLYHAFKFAYTLNKNDKVKSNDNTK